MASTRDVSQAAYSRGARGVRIYLNQGDGTWTARQVAGDVLFGDSMRTTDLNGDGKIDLVTSSSVDGYNKIVHLSDGAGGLTTLALETLRPRAIVLSVGVTDIDRDGVPDLVLGYRSSEVGVGRSGVDVYFTRAGKGGAPMTWERRALDNAEGNVGVTALDTGDLDGDGRDDVVASTGDGKVWIFVADGKGWFTRESGSPAGLTGCGGYEVKIADLDRDRIGDLVLGFAGEPTSGSVMAGVFNVPGEPECRGQGALQAWKLGKTAGKAAPSH
jgi:hypothetical protein